jgi:hypothetical protein
MVAGHLQEKKGLFYIVLSYSDRDGKRKTKWVPTGLPIKGNKRKAETMLQEARKTFVADYVPVAEDMLFVDYLTEWLEIAKGSVALTTYASYSSMLRIQNPNFKPQGLTLIGLQRENSGVLYTTLNVKASSVIHYQVISLCFEVAVRTTLSLQTLRQIDAPRLERSSAASRQR